MINKKPTANDYLVTCDRCGVWVHASKCKLEWTGLFVHEDRCWEARNEQDKLKVPTENLTVSIPRPKHSIPSNVCTVEGSSAELGVGVVGCLTVGDLLDPVFQSGIGIYN